MLNVKAMTIGIAVSALIFFNGTLSTRIGNIPALAIMYGGGLVLFIVFNAVNSRNVPFRRLRPSYAAASEKPPKPRESDPKHRLPAWMFSGGILGILVIFSENLAMREIGVSITVALLLSGQLVMSSIVDTFGLFGRTKAPIASGRLIAIGFVAAGILILYL